MCPTARRPISLSNPSPLASCFLGRRSGLPPSRVLPQELRETILDELGTRSLCTLRRVNKTAKTEIDQIRRPDFNCNATHFAAKGALGSMIARQNEATAALATGDVMQLFFEVDADLSCAGRTFTDEARGEQLIWTRSGQLVAVGAALSDGIEEVLPAGSLPGYGVAGADMGGKTVLEVLSCGPGKGRSVLTFHPLQGIRLWRHEAGLPVSFQTLRFGPREAVSDAAIVQGSFYLANDGRGVLFEMTKYGRSWRWHAQEPISMALELPSPQPDTRYRRVSAQDGLTLHVKGTHLVLSDPSAKKRSKSRILDGDQIVAILPFSPCGKFVATQNRCRNYQGGGVYRTIDSSSLFQIERNDDGVPSLKFLKFAEDASDLYGVGWVRNAIGGFSLRASGYVVDPYPRNTVEEKPYFGRTTRGESSQNSHTKTVLGYTRTGRAVGLDKTPGYRFDRFYRTDFDQSSKIRPIHADLADFFRSLRQDWYDEVSWSEDGTSALLRGRTDDDQNYFKRVELIRSRVKETIVEKAVRAARGIVSESMGAVFSVNRAISFIFPNFLTAVTAVYMGVSLSAYCLLTGLGVIAALGGLLGGVVLIAFSSAFVRNFASMRPLLPCRRVIVSPVND